MNQDPAVRSEAHSVLRGLFSGLGHHAQGGDSEQAPAGLNVEWMIEQAGELVTMPADLARIFVDMSVDLTELVLQALAEAGFVLVRGLTPA